MAKKLKGKEWYTLIAPKIFGEKVLGETPVGDPKSINNRVISASITTLMNDPSKYYFKLNFKVDEVKEKNAYMKFWGLEILRDYISRMIRHGVLRIDNSVVVTTRDDVKLRVKTITLTNRKAKKKIEILLRKFIKEKINKGVSKYTLDDFIKKILDDSFKRSVISEGSKIYPVYNFEVRKIERLD